VTNAANERQVRKRQQTAKDVDEQRERELKALLAIPEFRRYLWRHMNETCGILQSSANPNGSVQSINIGMQDVARILWAEIEAADPLAIPRMMTEHYQSQQEDHDGRSAA